MIGDNKVNLGPFATLFGHGCRFFDDRKAWGRGSDSAFGPAWRFSACFGRLGRCAQDDKNWGHGPADLLGRDRTCAAFPRQAHGSHQRTGQDQLVLHGSQKPRPTLKLFRRAQAGLVPEQGLFLETIAMLVGVAPLVERPDPSQGSRSLTNPEKPTHAGITLSVSRPKARHADHRSGKLTRLFQMQVLPGLHLQPMPFLVLIFPHPIRGTLRLWRVAFEALAIEASESRACPCGQGQADRRRDFSPAGSVCHRPHPSFGAGTARCRNHDHRPQWPAHRPPTPSGGSPRAVARLPLAQPSACWQCADGRASSPNCWAPAAEPPLPKTASRGSTFVLSLGRLGTYTSVRSAAVGERGRAMLLLSKPTSLGSPAVGAGTKVANSSSSEPCAMRPSWRAWYRLGQPRWKNGESDNWAKDCACG